MGKGGSAIYLARLLGGRQQSSTRTSPEVPAPIPAVLGSTPKMAWSRSTEATSHSPRPRTSRAVNAATFSLSRYFDVSCPLLMRLHDTCFICLSSNSALVVLHRAVKVLNRTVVTDPQTCAHVLQHRDIVTNH